MENPIFIRIKATTLFSICHKLNDLLIQWLLDEELQQISYNSLRQIMIDVNYLENYATDNNKESAEAFIQVHSCSRGFLKKSVPKETRTETRTVILRPLSP